MKKLIILAILLSSYMQVMADVYTDNNGIKWSFTINGVNAINVKPYARSEISGDVVIPEKMYSYTVTSIGNGAFASCHSMTNVTMPLSLTSIGEYAFQNCDGLTNIVIPSNVTSIGNNAFEGCISLVSVDTPSNLTNVGKKAFSGCVSLNSVTINGNSIFSCSKDYGDYLSLVHIFGNQVEQYILNEGVTTIPRCAFYGCSGLNSITISSSVTIIEKYAFNGCSGLKSITIPSSVTTIGENAFYGCSGLKSITIPSSVTAIGSYAFSGCSGLTKVIVQDIAAWCNITFGNSSSNPLSYAHHLYSDENTEINNLEIPSEVTSIESYAFYGCYGLTSITIPSNVTSIGSDTFYGCSGLRKVIVQDIAAWCNITFCNSYSNPLSKAYHLYSDENTEIIDLEIPSEVKSIGSYAFSGCSNLISVSIPNSVTSIGSYAFEGCTGVTSVTINSQNVMAYAMKNLFGSQVKQYIIGDDVTTISSNTFNDCNGLTSITIPSSVTTIGENAFYGCSGLKSITIPSSVTTIGSYAFSGCSRLTKVIVQDIAAWCNITFGNSSSNPLSYAHHLYSDENTEINNLEIPSEVTSIESYAFYGCSGLTSITIPNNVTSIGDNAFYGCSGLTSVTIGNSVKSIGSYAFYNCNGLTSITIPNNVTSIGGNAFYGCSGLTSVTIGNSVKSIGSYAFSGCTGVTSITIPSSVTSIGYSAFYNCSGLTKVIVKDIAAWCNISFNYSYSNPLSYAQHLYSDENTEITNLVIPSGVTSIGSYAFYGCRELSSVTIPSSVTRIGKETFCGCSGLTKVLVNDIAAWCNVTFGDSDSNPLSHAYHLYSDENTEIINLEIPSGVTSISSYAFKGCYNLTSVSIPNSVTTIGEDVFSGCTELDSVTINSQTVMSCSMNNMFGGHVQRFVIGDGVSTILSNTFKDCFGLTSITIPSSVTSIDENAFYGCNGLKKVIVKDIAVWCNIAFGNSISNPLSKAHHLYSDDNTEIINLVIPSGVTSIGSYAFYGCSDLTSVSIPDNVTTIGENVFSRCTNLTSVTINSPTIMDYSMKNIFGSQVKQYIISDGVTVIHSNTFKDCTELTSITIPSSVKSIDEDAFYDCSRLRKVIVQDIAAWCNITFGNLKSNPLSKAYHIYSDENTEIIELEIPSEVTSIGSYAFYGCHNLTSASIPNSVTSIGSYAFYWCSGLTSVSIPNSVTTIGEDVFSYCTGLTSIIIPNSVKSIGSHAFYNCTGLVSVTIPNSVKTIESSTFRSCTGLVSATIPNSVKSIGDHAFSGCTGLTSITIPSSVTSIGEDAFYSCTSLAKVTIKRESPVDITKDVFSNRANATLIVPTGSKAAYEAADYWKDFKEIIELPAPSPAIVFADANVKALCVANWDTDNDGELSEAEAAAVTSLGEVFKGNTEITSFNELQYFTNLTTIDGNAFKNCSSLTSVSIPNSVTSIGNEAFSGCSSLTKVIVSDIASWCLITFNAAPSNPLYYAHHLYSDENTEITDLVIPEGVTSIGNFAFCGCSSLTSVIIPSSVTSIGICLFYGCTCLASIAVSEGNITYDSRNHCNAIVETTSNSLISGCKNTVIPDNVTSIGDYAFSGCSDLISVSIPNSVTSIGDYAFEWCSGLTKVIVSDIAAWCDIAFGGGSSNPLRYAHHLYSDESTEITDLVIPEGVTSISDEAFVSCSGLTSVNIPNSVVIIEDDAFFQCSNLTSVTVNFTSPLTINQNCFSNRANATLYVPTGCKAAYEAADYWKDFKEIIELSAPSPAIDFADANVKALCIANWDTDNDGELSMAEAAAVTSLGEVFKGNTEITSFNELQYFTGITELPAWNAFNDCIYLNSIVIPAGVTNIEGSAFPNCSALQNISVDAGNSVYDSRNNCNAIIKTATNKLVVGCEATQIPDGITTIGNAAFWGRWGMQKMNIPQTVTTIERSAFSWCVSLNSITLPASVNTIEDEAFSNCGNLTSVYCDIETPPAITENVFTNRANATLYVPAGSKTAYEAADYWKEFGEIVGMTNIIANSDLEGDDVSCFYIRENMDVVDEIIPATIVDGVGKDGSRGIVVQSVDNPQEAWNTQFFVRMPQSLPAGTKYRLMFDYKASQDAQVTMESHKEPSEFISGFGSTTFNTSWQHYESEGTITEVQSPNDNQMRTIGFTLAYTNTATTYYFDNVVFEIDNVEQPSPAIVPGDANGDGVIDTQDAIKVVQYYLGKNPTDFNIQAADVNNDGVVDTQDAIQIIKIYLKK